MKTDATLVGVGQRLKRVLPPRGWKALKRFAARHLFARNLHVLATIHGSDKWGDHWYAQHYQRHFSPLRSKPLVLLEIGIGGFDDPHAGGASLRMWRDYFPKGSIVGVDIFDKRPHDGDRIRTFVGDQSDAGFLRELIAEVGTPDIVIDDGSHINRHVIESFEVLFPLLADSGIYVIEDLGSSYWPDYGGAPAGVASAPTGMNLLKGLVDGLNHKEFLQPHYQPSYSDENVVSLHFYHNIAFCFKGKNHEKGSRRTAIVRC